MLDRIKGTYVSKGIYLIAWALDAHNGITFNLNPAFVYRILQRNPLMRSLCRMSFTFRVLSIMHYVVRNQEKKKKFICKIKYYGLESSPWFLH